MECKCYINEVVFTYPTGQSGIKPQIVYCPLHESAPGMYEALRQFERMGFFKESSTYLRGLRNIIAKAEGRE